MFEQRILCHKLPNSFDSITIDNNEEQCLNKRHKIIQDLKRQLLNVELQQYEIQIQHYEDLYEQEINAFERETFNLNSSYQMYHFNTLIYCVKIYVYHHTNILIREIRYKESCLHIKLLRHSRRRQSLTTKTNNIDVYPQIIVDVPKVSLNRNQLDYLSHNGKLKFFFNTYVDRYELLLIVIFFFLFHMLRTQLYPTKSKLSSFI
jgi:hypothetical protein